MTATFMTPHRHRFDATPPSDDSVPVTPEEHAPPADTAITSAEVLCARCAELENELAFEREETLRARAEFENARKRLIRETEDVRSYANEKIVQDIFPVLDSLEMTLSHADEKQHQDPVIAGVELVLKQFKSVLAKHGLEDIGVAGEVFDPHWHEAIATATPPEGALNGTIVTVHRKGYKLKGRLVRAAMVTVAQ